MSYPVEEHANYLADSVRIRAYRRALSMRVCPGDVVVDLGSGTGVLGLLACAAGASRVYCIDAGPMLDVAREHVEQSPYRERFTFFQRHSEEIDLPERADLVVADQMGAIGLWAGLLPCFADARRRFLKPGGGLLPGTLRIQFSAVEESTFPRQLEAIASNVGDLGLARFRHLLVNDFREVGGRDARQLTDPGTFKTLQLGVDEPDLLTGSFDLEVTSAGAANGLLGWFSAGLAAEIDLTNCPFGAESIGREGLFLPFGDRAELEPGDTLRVSLSIASRDAFCAWHVQRIDASGHRTTITKRTSLASRLLNRGSLGQGHAQHRPLLNPMGELKRFVLELCDANNTVESIIDAVYKRYPEHVRSPRRAEELVLTTLRNLTQ